MSFLAVASEVPKLLFCIKVSVYKRINISDVSILWAYRLHRSPLVCTHQDQMGTDILLEVFDGWTKSKSPWVDGSSALGYGPCAVGRFGNMETDFTFSPLP